MASAAPSTSSRTVRAHRRCLVTADRSGATGRAPACSGGVRPAGRVLAGGAGAADVPKVVTHMVVVGALAATIALLMFAIYQLQNPFSGGALVPPDAFVSAAERMPAA